MNPALRGGVTLLVCLLAVFPCGAGLTVLGTLVAEAARVLAGHEHSSEKLAALWTPAVWAGTGVLGFLSLIYGVDKLLLAERRLPWYVLFGILLGMAAAGFFSVTYPLRSHSAVFLRLVCVAPVGFELLVFLIHLVRFIRIGTPAVQSFESASTPIASEAEDDSDR